MAFSLSKTVFTYLYSILSFMKSVKNFIADVKLLLFTHTCPVTEFAVASHLNTANSCCHHVFLRHFRFQKCLPVYSNVCRFHFLERCASPAGVGFCFRTASASGPPSAAGETVFIYFINGISINDQPGVHSFESFSFLIFL